MKQFLKYVLATIVGLIITGFLAGVFFFISLAGLALAGSTTSAVAKNSVLVVKLTGLMSERAIDNPISQFTGDETTLGLNTIVKSVKEAKNNDNIKGIYIQAGTFAADSYASMQALRDALADFRKSGKWIIAYADGYTQGAYYISSVADKVYLNPQGFIDWHGLAAQPTYYKDLLAKFGVKMQVAKVGTYKSYVEAYTADKMSDANREQVTAYINVLWNKITADVSKSRKIPVARLNQMADSLSVVGDANACLKAGMVDSLMYADQLKSAVKKQLGVDHDDDINQAMPEDVNAMASNGKGDEIAVYYACGSVVNGASNTIQDVIDSKRVCADLEELADDDDVKAVVLRVNSGGGSAYASEQIWHSVVELKKRKPVVVSMGGMAASGAYYLSCPADKIIAEPTTLTGSIGIFGMFPDMSGLLKDKLGLKFDVVKTNAHSDFGTVTRPFTPQEMHYIEQYINKGYQLFRQRVADGRHMTTAQVEKIAQGHVFAGTDALKIHLVDQLGSLDDAVAAAAKLAKLKKYHAEEYPAQDSWMDMFLESQTYNNYLDSHMQSELGPLYEPIMFLRNLNRTDAVQARIPFDLNVN